MFYSRLDYEAKFKMLKKYVGSSSSALSLTIVEVGAHYGEDTMRLADTFPDARIYAFEPDPRNWEMIQEYLTEEQKNKVTFFNSAVSDVTKNGVPFYRSYDDSGPTEETLAKYGWIPREAYLEKKLNRSGSSSLKQGTEELLDTVMVDCYTLDFCQSTFGYRIDLLWIDVQGAERDVLAGGKEILKSTNFIWMEYGEQDSYDGAMNLEQTTQLLREYNFCVINSSGEGTGDLLAARNIISLKNT